MTSLLPRVACAALIANSPAVPAADVGLDVTRADVGQFITDMERTDGFDRESLDSLLRTAQPQPQILDLIQRPAERTLAWWEYRQRFLTEARIDGGVALWQAHREELQRVSEATGVPAEYLVAITGVETFYGRITGRYRVLDALSTLGFDYPPRGEYFRGELRQFLLMAREEGLDPRTPLGSYAGAMGVAQFMPSSVRHYAVDATRDGRRDMWQYGPDVFASIANYFHEHGWRTGEPVLSDAVNAAAPDDPAAAKLVITDSVASLRLRGYEFDTTLPDDSPALLVPAALESGMTWRVGFQNFYVITRYNRSFMYAMAVHELAQAIATRYDAAQRATASATEVRQP